MTITQVTQYQLAGFLLLLHRLDNSKKSLYIQIIFSKKAGIMRRPQNLLDIQSHCVITQIMLSFLSIDQMKNYFLQYYYHQLGPEWVFQIWSNSFVMENLG